jgi:hypothetical protein
MICRSNQTKLIRHITWAPGLLGAQLV